MRFLPLLLLLAVDCTSSEAADVLVSADAPAVDPPPMVAIPAVERRLALPLSDDVLALLRTRSWPEAADALLRIDPGTLPGNQRGDWAFVTSWCLAHADRAAEAERLLPLLSGADSAPRDFVALVEGEVLRAADRKLEALAALDRVPAESVAWARAAVERAEVLKALERRTEGYEVYSRLVARPDPAPGNDVALLALAQRAGAGSGGAYVYLRRLWANYPGTDAEIEGRRMLAGYGGDATFQPTLEELSLRGEALARDSRWDDAIALLGPALSKATGSSVEACRVRYVYGRSLYKRNKLTDAVAALTGMKACPADYGAPGLYLVGTAEMRRKRYDQAAAAFTTLARAFPGTSYTDDGFTHAGIALQELGRNDEARKLWVESLDAAPDGDTVPESTWRLAWTLYLEGDPKGAIAVATKLGGLPLGADPVHVAAGRYWAARWRLYPDVHAPNQPVADAAERQAAIDGWAKLCEELPTSFYAILAYSRLVEVAPEVAERLAARAPDHDYGDVSKPWNVRRSVYDDPEIRAGVQLARVGLSQEALAEWSQVDLDQLTAEEMAWLVELRTAAGDWLFAHRWFRDWLKTHPPGIHGDSEPRVLRVAYPDRYWDVVQRQAKGYVYEPRLFHALCREESDFNVVIRSHSGALGLSQLMPATSREVAGWLGISITNASLLDPEINARLGSRYLDAMHKQLGGSPYLATAAYNGGAGNVKKWDGEWGDVPTDEFVERIPLRETRFYVKRVMGTWQLMRWQFDRDVPAFPDLSRYNHVALE